MNQALRDAIAAVARERGGKFVDSFDAAALLVDQYGEDELADRILSEIPTTISWEVVADLLGILVWSTKDNGSSISRQSERWLVEGVDSRKVQVALHLEAYPFEELEQMKQVLGRLALAMPQFAERCRELIQQRQAEEPA